MRGTMAPMVKKKLLIMAIVKILQSLYFTELLYLIDIRKGQILIFLKFKTFKRESK